ncbi:chemotaxis protein [Mycobacterium heidelbergense]|uniref:chemotaxis protein n=1 Tax=Mycobacterium heidelbergense TaxID=53376 RepID=UPI003CFA743B
MPVAGRREGATVGRDLAASDLELARMAVAELAGAASVTDPGLDWAVAVGRNTSGMPTLWVATNDGAAYIPPGVFLRKTMPVAGGHSEEFDARWFGWVNPADKAVRAARECADNVGAVATTWAWPSEFLAEHPAVPEVATGVKPVGVVDNPAAELLPSRSHRLQTVDAALYADLVAADDSMVRDYCRELTRQLAFGIPGEELSSVAQSVAHALVAQRWPKAEEWALLGEQHEDALVMMAAQRPGLDGVENPGQIVSYTREFVKCRRLEALLCWERHGADLLNVVYAAWVAGLRAPLKDLVLQ